MHCPLAFITDTPQGARQTQLLFGERFRVIDERDGFAFGQAERDGYCGYVVAHALAGDTTPTHWVGVRATHLYPEPAFKAHAKADIFFTSQVRVIAEAGAFWQISTGDFVPRPHLHPLPMRLRDPVTVAGWFLGTPYVWAGCSQRGIDCSGLVQQVLRACGYDCPRDSDQQRAVGRPLPLDTPPDQGDLVFWNGHVGIMASGGQFVHATAHAMAVVCEPFATVCTRMRTHAHADVVAQRRLADVDASATT